MKIYLSVSSINVSVKMSIQQKLVLTQRVEDFEMDRERHTLQHFRERGEGGGDRHPPPPQPNQKRAAGGGQRASAAGAGRAPTTRAVPYPAGEWVGQKRV